MANDIVQRLLAGTTTEPGCHSPTCGDVDKADVLMSEAAAHIESQDRRIAELEKALQPFADAVFNDNGDIEVNLSVDAEDLIQAYFTLRRARSLLLKKEG